MLLVLYQKSANNRLFNKEETKICQVQGLYDS